VSTLIGLTSLPLSRGKQQAASNGEWWCGPCHTTWMEMARLRCEWLANQKKEVGSLHSRAKRRAPLPWRSSELRQPLILPNCHSDHGPAFISESTLR